MKLEFVPMWDVDEHWAEIAPMLEKAIARQSAMSLDSTYQDLKRGKFFLWRVPGKAAFVTEIQNFPQERVCVVVLCGGEGIEEWLPAVDETIVRHARCFGCAALLIVGRRGWERVCPEFRVTDYVLRRSL